MKTLRVCLASELPDESDRSPDYLYFAYDKLYLYSGQNYLEDNFAIVDAIPEEQVYGMLYILNTDGTVHRLVDYVDTVIATIEDASQIPILQKAGTMFYVNANHRYIDSQRRVLTLPFNDGSYELNVSTKRETVYDENTILKYNPDKERFEVYGDTSEEFIDYSKPFRGATTSSVEMKVDGPRVSGMVRVSKEESNILKAAEDGLYIPAGKYVTKEVFDQWSKEVFDIKNACEEILRKASKDIEQMEDYISPEYIQTTVINALDARFGDIETALENYNNYVNDLDRLENQVVNYAANAIVGARNTLLTKLNDYETIEDLDSSPDNYSHEVNYYEKAEEWYYPD